MTGQLLTKCGLGASDGGADAAGGEVEGGGHLGVGQAAVAQDEGDGLPAGEPLERGADAAAVVEGDDRVGDVRGDRLVAGPDGQLAGGAPAAGAEGVQGGVGGGDRQPAGGLAG